MKFSTSADSTLMHAECITSFTLSVAGAMLTAAAGNPLAAMIAIGAAALGYQPSLPQAPGGYTYLFQAQQRFGY